MSQLRKKPRRSLRAILIFWFLLFSTIPLAFVTAYSILKFEKAIDREMSQRLSGNAREFEGILADFRAGLQQRRDRYTRDPAFQYNISTSDSASIKAQLSGWLPQEFSTSLTVFARDGRMLVSVFKDEKGETRNYSPSAEAVFLSDKYITHLKQNIDYGLVEMNESQKTSLILISRVLNSNGRIIGYLEQIIDLDQAFLLRLKARMKLEFMLLRENGQLATASHSDFYLYKKDFFQRYLTDQAEPFFEISLRGNPFGFYLYKIDWDKTSFYVALGASKSDAKEVLKNINVAFITVVGAVFLLILVTVFIISSWVLRPLYELVDALQSFESQEQAVTIPIKNDTEIGILTESFNEMSKKIWQARSDLQKKVQELESANRELKETQTRLVHSAKMVSLGQLVAGVAHELNNPIGFIFANMAHLREYSNKLIQLVRMVSPNDKEFAKAKQESEFEYIVTDMPKLISSCEDGARRTRDIVLGLRNFSRLEEAKLKEVDLHEAIDTTLALLHGEMKNRIQVHKQFEPIPLVMCYASQINQVLMNILSNAAQAIEGTGQIWISTQVMKANKDEIRRVQISIQDSGKGMSSEVIEKIFDPFFTTKGVGQGTGLGLSISYGIIQNHGGEILVKSEPKVGTEFIIILPVHS